MPENTVFCHLSSHGEDELLDARSSAWAQSDKISIDRYWDGRFAFKEKGPDWKNLTEVSSLWTRSSLFVRFCCWFDSLHVNPAWETDAPVRGLWEKDVVEAFVRPESCDDYFEVEASPLGQWLDLHVIKPRVDVDYRWDSELKVQTKVDNDAHTWSAILRLPFAPMMRLYSNREAPGIGDAWRLNLYRMTGEDPDREFLAWCPTFTARPDFHIPSAFGNLIFLDSDGFESGVTEGQ